MAITFERAELFESVWAKPLRDVADEHGLSDTGLRKICRTLAVPVPPRGYWARKAAGQTVIRPTLRPTQGPTKFVSRPPSAASPERVRRLEEEQWLTERLAYDEAHPVVVRPPRSRWHPAVAALRIELIEGAQKLIDSRRAQSRFEKLSEAARRRVPNFDGALWLIARDRGQIVCETHHAFPVRVSLEHYRRALVLLNAISVAATERGYRAWNDENAGRVALEAMNARIGIRIAERFDRGVRTERRYDGKEESVSFLIPTGQLRVFAGAQIRSEREIADLPNRPLEQRMGELFHLIYRQTLRECGHQREIEAVQARWRSEERLHQERVRRAENRDRRRAQLLEDAQAWQQAETLRAYVQSVEAQAGSPLPHEVAVWVRWARWIARSMDPSSRALTGASART